MLEIAQNAPEEIRSAVWQSLMVRRYKETYAEGIFSDSTGRHTGRCIEIADSLPLTDASKDLIKRYLWVHDLPEVITSDTTIIEKEGDPGMARRLREAEEKAAREILSDADYQLYLQFNLASDALKGKQLEQLPPPEAIIAKIIDAIDGNLLFHRQLACWMSSDEYETNKVPIETALVYTFKSFDTYMENLSNLDLSESYLSVARELLTNQLNQVVEYWKQVPQDRIPEVLAGRLA